MERLAISPDTTSVGAGRPGEGTPSPPDGDQDLCRKLQAYMACRFRKGVPPAPLAEAWDHFYDAYSPRIRAFLRRSGLPEADREDCFQDVWSEVVAHLGHLRYDPGRARLSTWLMTVARNRAVDTHRRRQRFAPGLIEDWAALVDSGPGPDAACEQHSTQAQVRSVLGELSGQVSETSFRVLRLRGIEDRTCAEVADTLGLTPEQVRFRLHRIKRKFRALFEQSVDPDRSQGEWGRPGNCQENIGVYTTS